MSNELEMRIAELEAELARIKRNAAEMSHEVEQILGQALGFPPAYPDVSPVDNGEVVTGPCTVEILAEMAAEKITALKEDQAAKRRKLMHYNEELAKYDAIGPRIEENERLRQKFEEMLEDYWDKCKCGNSGKRCPYCGLAAAEAMLDAAIAGKSDE